MRHKYKIKIETPPAEARKHGENRHAEKRPRWETAAEISRPGQIGEEREDGPRQAEARQGPNTNAPSVGAPVSAAVEAGPGAGAAAPAPEPSATVREDEFGRVRKVVDELSAQFESLAKRLALLNGVAEAQGGTPPENFPARQSARPGAEAQNSTAQGLRVAESQKQAHGAMMEMLGTLHALNMAFARRLAAVHQQWTRWRQRCAKWRRGSVRCTHRNT